MRLVAPSSLSHVPVAVRPSPTVRPMSSTVPAVRVLSATGAPTAAAAAATSISAVSMPTAPTTMKRKREDDDDDDYDMT